MANREIPGSPKTWVQRFRLFLGLTKNRRGAKVGHAGPGERTLSPPPPPPHVPEVVDAVAVDEAKAEANRGRRRPRRRNKNQDEGSINSPYLKQEGLGDPASQDSTLESLDPPVIIAATEELPAVAVNEAKDEGNKQRRRRRKAKNQDEGTLNSLNLQDALGEREPTLESLAPPVIIAAPPVIIAAPPVIIPATQELPTAETDTDSWQVVARKKQHGGRAERPAQGLVLEHDTLVRATPERTTAEHRHGPKKQQPRWTARPANQTAQRHPASTLPKPTPPRIAAQTAQRHAQPSPPSPASTPSKSTPLRIAAQHGKREENDDDLGTKRMDQEEDSEREEETDDEEYNGREEDDEMHLSYWIKNKDIKSKDKSKTLCLICYLERKHPVPEITNKETEIERHLKKVHKMQKRKAHRCQSKGCWVRARNRRDIGRHQFICHNL